MPDIPGAGHVFPSFSHGLRIHHFPTQDAVGVPVALHVGIDPVHAQPVDEQVGGRVVAFRDHQVHGLLKGHPGSVPPALEDAGSSTTLSG